MDKNFIEKQVAAIREQVGDKKVLLGLSGGVDSSVCAALIHKAIGNNLNQLTVLANMGKVQFANLDTAAQEFARINTSLRELQEGGAAKSQSSIS